MTRSTTRRKRLLIVLATLATASAMLAIPVSASFDHHFTVAVGEARIKPVATDKFRGKAWLLNPRHRRERVGRLWGIRKALSAGKSHYQIHFRLSGQIGGSGNIRATGNFGVHDRRLNVVGGNHDFNGVAGKVVFGDRQLAHFDLTR